VEQAIW